MLCARRILCEACLILHKGFWLLLSCEQLKLAVLKGFTRRRLIETFPAPGLPPPIYINKLLCKFKQPRGVLGFWGFGVLACLSLIVFAWLACFFIVFFFWGTIHDLCLVVIVRIVVHGLSVFICPYIQFIYCGIVI